MKPFVLAASSLVFSLGLMFTFPLEAARAVRNASPQDSAAQATSATIYDLMEKQKNLGKFVDMIGAADLKELFRGPDVITVFAPDDEAMDAISRDVMKRIKASKENEQSFVRYHVIVGSRVGMNAISGRKSSPAMANGESVTLDGTKEPAKVNDGHLVASDLTAGNSVLHIISAALIPSALLQDQVKPADKTPPSPAAAVTAATNSKTSGLTAIGTAALTGPAGTSAPTANVGPEPAPLVDAPPADQTPAPANKGYTFFGHTFGGSQ